MPCWEKKMLKMANSIVFKLAHLYIFLLNFVYMLVSISSSMIINNNKYIKLMLCYFLWNWFLIDQLYSCILLSLQNIPMYPSRQPSEHSPLTWSHVLLLIQCPLQRSVQFIPKYWYGQSIWKQVHSEFH